jgi:hypothetical protein
MKKFNYTDWVTKNKHGKTLKEGMSPEEWGGAKEKERLNQHPEKDKINKIKKMMDKSETGINMVKKKLDALGVKYEMSKTDKVRPFKVIYKPINKSDQFYDKFEDIVDLFNLKDVVKSINEDYKPSHRAYNVIDKSNNDKIVAKELSRDKALELAKTNKDYMIDATDRLAETRPDWTPPPMGMGGEEKEDEEQEEYDKGWYGESLKEVASKLGYLNEHYKGYKTDNTLNPWNRPEFNQDENNAYRYFNDLFFDGNFQNPNELLRDLEEFHMIEKEEAKRILSQYFNDLMKTVEKEVTDTTEKQTFKNSMIKKGFKGYLKEVEDYELEDEDMDNPDEDLVIIGSGYLDIKNKFKGRPNMTNGELAALGQKVVDQLHNGDQEAAFDYIMSKINEVDGMEGGIDPNAVQYKKAEFIYAEGNGSFYALNLYTGDGQKQKMKYDEANEWLKGQLEYIHEGDLIPRKHNSGLEDLDLIVDRLRELGIEAGHNEYDFS